MPNAGHTAFVVQGVSIEKLEDLYATAMDYGITLVTISHEPGTSFHPFHLHRLFQMALCETRC